MKKIILLILLSVTTPAIAQFELNDANTSAQVSENNKVIKDEKNPFSFMNFSFIKKKTSKTADIDKPKTETFIEKLTRQANEGDAQSLSALGYIYLYGDEKLGIKQDYKKAFEYYTKASEKDDVVATNNLANLYFSGIGVEENKQIAAKLFEKASNLGSVEASVNLAFMYLSGNGIRRSPQEAVALLAKASEKNNAIAQYMLGLCYYSGYVLPQNYHKAFEYIRKSANAGYDEAQVTLAQLYMNGFGVPQNYGIAIGLLDKAVSQDNLTAMYNLANILAEGSKFPRDLFYAHVLYNLASVRGQHDAAEKRIAIEKSLKIEDILKAQTQANAFVARPSEITTYTRRTFGKDLRSYIKK